jgi:hypothetical protein
VHEELPVDVQRWKQGIGVMEERASVQRLLAWLGELKENAGRELNEVSRDLEVRSKECENTRVSVYSWNT